MSTPAEPCRARDGTGYVETAAQDSRVIHHEPCPDCAGPAVARADAPLVQAVRDEYVCVLARREHWRLSTWGERQTPQEQLIFEQGARAALLCVATRIGVQDLHERAVQALARVQEGRQP